MTQVAETPLQQARRALKQNDTAAARRFLQTAVRERPEDHRGWLLLASIAENPHTALAHVQKAAQLSPHSPTVQKALVWAQRRAADADTPAAVEPAPAAAGPARRRLLWAGGALLLMLLLVTGWTLFRPANTSAPAVALPPATATPESVAAAGSGNGPANGSPAAADEIAAETAAATPMPTSTAAPLIPAKQVSLSKAEGEQPRATWTLTPTPTPTPSPTSTPMPTFVAPQDGSPVSRPFGVGPNERWIDVNLSTQTLVAYEGNTPVLTTLISSGTYQFPTVTGQFRIYLTYESQTMDGRRLGYDYYLEGVPFVMYFYKDYALHGTFWHNNFGTPMSHGCVNMKTSEAGWLYSWASIGTLVNVHY